MELYVDDKMINEDFVFDGTLEDALREIQSNVHNDGRLVIGLRCDGQPVASNAMTETLKRPAPSVSRLDILTGTKEALVTDAMTQSATSLSDTESTAVRVAELLVEGKTEDAIKDLGQCLAIWQQIHEAVIKSIEILGADPEKMRVRDGSLIDAMSRPKEVLLQVRDALQTKDYVLLADILQYEFSEVTESWLAIIARIRQQAEDQQTD